MCCLAACGGVIELNDGDPPGYITSPNYPQNYPQNIDCFWVISVPNGEAVKIDFEDEFYIELSDKYGCFMLALGLQSLLGLQMTMFVLFLSSSAVFTTTWSCTMAPT